MLGKNNKPLLKEGLSKNQILDSIVNRVVDSLKGRRGYENITVNDVKVIVLFFSKVLLESTDVGFKTSIPHLGFISLKAVTKKRIFKEFIKEVQDNNTDPLEKPLYFRVGNNTIKKVYKKAAHDCYKRSVFNIKNLPDFKTFKYSYPKLYGKRQMPHDYQEMVNRLKYLEKINNAEFVEKPRSNKGVFSLKEFISYQRSGIYGGAVYEEDANKEVQPNDFL